MREVSVKQAKAALNYAVKVKQPVFLWGSPGIGKSDTVSQLCNELGGKMYDIRLSLLEPTDLRGIPFFNKNTSKMEWAPPVDLPDAETAKKYPYVFVFFDELNSAVPSVQAACYQIALNRKIGTYELPENAVIIAAGNKESDRGVTYRMPSPLANRFIHLELKVDFDDWLEWAVNNNIHSDVIGFLSFSKNSLFDFDAQSNEKAFATPRSWSFVSNLLNESDIPENLATTLIAGAVGEGMALKFMAHRKISSKLPKPIDVVTGKVTELKTNEISAHYSLATSIAYEMKEIKNSGKKVTEWDKYTDNVLGFMMANFSPEVLVMSMRVMLNNYGLPFNPSKMKNFKPFYEKYGKLIIKAAS